MKEGRSRTGGIWLRTELIAAAVVIVAATAIVAAVVVAGSDADPAPTGDGLDLTPATSSAGLADKGPADDVKRRGEAVEQQAAKSPAEPQSDSCDAAESEQFCEALEDARDNGSTSTRLDPRKCPLPTRAQCRELAQSIRGDQGGERIEAGECPLPTQEQCEDLVRRSR